MNSNWMLLLSGQRTVPGDVRASEPEVSEGDDWSIVEEPEACGLLENRWKISTSSGLIEYNLVSQFNI